jgi:2-aminophenol/2-amino-5-chlorophenol 1,6-dioxygenase alpha subunit
MSLVCGFLSPCRPHILLQAEANPGWQRLHDAFAEARLDLEKSGAELLLLYSTQWPSVIGHQIQADPEPKWNLVDQDFHALGTMDYHLRMDSEFAELYKDCAQARGLTARTVAYRGFPIDTGTLVALQLLNPENRIPACVVSCNMYADRQETIVLGKAARDAIDQSGKKTAVVAVTALSNRMWTSFINPADDRIHSPKDEEWNLKLLELLQDGRLEDVSQLARQFSEEAHGDQKLKAIWWLAAAMGQHNRYTGHLYGYEPVWGTGQALLRLNPAKQETGTLEYDEDGAEHYQGDRSVLSSGQKQTS